MKKIITYLFLISFLISCDFEHCKIDFKQNSKRFNRAVNEIHSLNLKMDSKEPYFRIVKSFTKATSPIESNIFDQIDFVECHEDGTIIFQAPNCVKESSFSDIVYFVAFSRLGYTHIEQKRNIGTLNKIDENWFIGTHINSLAN